MQLVLNFLITVKPSNTFQYLPIPNLQWLLQIADKNQLSGTIYDEIFLKKTFRKWSVIASTSHLRTETSSSNGAPNEAPSDL